MSKDNIREHSAPVYEGIENAPARSMMRATGFKDSDFTRPFVGIASTWANVTPCNMHINELAREAEKGSIKQVVKVLFLIPSPFQMVFLTALKA